MSENDNIAICHKCKAKFRSGQWITWSGKAEDNCVLAQRVCLNPAVVDEEGRASCGNPSLVQCEGMDEKSKEDRAWMGLSTYLKRKS